MGPVRAATWRWILDTCLRFVLMFMQNIFWGFWFVVCIIQKCFSWHFAVCFLVSFSFLLVSFFEKSKPCIVLLAEIHSSMYKVGCICLQMELRTEGPSTPSVIYDEQGNMIDSRGEGGEPIQFVFEEIVWSAELSREEASRHLEVTMYPFKKVSPLTPNQQTLFLYHRFILKHLEICC